MAISLKIKPLAGLYPPPSPPLYIFRLIQYNRGFRAYRSRRPLRAELEFKVRERTPKKHKFLSSHWHENFFFTSICWCVKSFFTSTAIIKQLVIYYYGLGGGKTLPIVQKYGIFLVILIDMNWMENLNVFYIFFLS